MRQRGVRLQKGYYTSLFLERLSGDAVDGTSRNLSVSAKEIVTGRLLRFNTQLSYHNLLSARCGDGMKI